MMLTGTRGRAYIRAAILLLAALALPAHAAVLRVKAGAPGPGHDGAAWNTAFASVAGALSASSDGDEIWVATGVYTEALTLKPGVSLYGGFGGDETSRAARDPRRNETILDGAGSHRVVYSPPGVDSDTVLDGFTIRNGSAATNPENGFGGGLLCFQSRPLIRNNRFVGNTATNGSAIAVKNATDITLENNIVEGNTGGNPGIYLLNTSANITGGSVVNNRSTATVPTAAGGIYCENGALTLERCVVRGNMGSRSPYGAGAGGVAVVGSNVTGAIRACLITSNSGPTGGILAANTRIESTLVAGNTGTSGAGGISAASCALVNNTIAANSDNGIGSVTFSGKGNVLSNSIIAFNATGIATLPGADGFSLTGSNNCFYANAAVANEGDPANPGGLQADPRFVNVSAGNFHIQPDSPCRDAGQASAAPDGVDMDGQPRVQGGRVDIGADESDGTARNAAAPVQRVAPDGDDKADGRTWQTAKKTLQAAVDALPDGGEVWAAAGRYAPSGDGNAVATLPPFVSLYGGFAGTETERSARDWRTNPSVIDGGGNHMGVFVQGGYRANVVDGFTVTNTDSPAGYAGSGIMCDVMAGPVISHNKLAGNRMGRLYPQVPASRATAALAVGGPALITDNIISDNISDTPGINCYGGCPLIRNNTVTGNSGGMGAAVFLPGQLPGGPLFINNIFAHNTSGFFAVQRLGQLPVFRNNCIFDNGEGFVNLPDPAGSDGNIAADPLFADFEMGDNHLTAGSPCVDAGADYDGAAEEQDMDGESRLIGTRVDIGADEYSDLVPVAPRHIVRVKPDGSDDGDGGTWKSAVKTIQHGINLAAKTGGEVWVAAGSYTDNLRLAPRVYLFGDFVGTETRRAERPPLLRATIITPAARGSLITIEDTGLYAGVDGFLIRQGATDTVGGGISCHFASPAISNNVISVSRANRGAGIALSRSFARIHDNVLEGNEADWDGGAIYATDGSDAVIERNWLTENTARMGAGIATNGASPLMRNNLFTMNKALLGAAFYGEPGSDYPRIINNTFVANSDDQPTSGSAVEAKGMGLLANNIIAFSQSGARWPGEMRNNDIYGNTAFNVAGHIGPNPIGRDGNISADPLFVNRSAFNYRLEGGSPAIDAGDDTLATAGERDFDGGPRIRGLHVDMGAFESGAAAPGLPDAVQALRVAGGLSILTRGQKIRLNVVKDGGSASTVDILDALALLRQR